MFQRREFARYPLHYPKRFGYREGLIAIPTYIETWQEAEVNAVVRLRELGYWDAVVTRPGTDSIDVASSRMVGQVKREQAPVGLPKVAHLYGTHGGGSREVWFFSQAGFGYTAKAMKFADEKGILLFTYKITGELEPINEIATLVLQERLLKRVNRLNKQIRGRERWCGRVGRKPERDHVLRGLTKSQSRTVRELGELMFFDLPEESRACAALELSFPAA